MLLQKTEVQQGDKEVQQREPPQETDARLPETNDRSDGGETKETDR